MNQYYFEGLRFIPGYNDFDFYDIKIEAIDETTAWQELDRKTNAKTWKSVYLTKINDQKIDR